MSLQYEISYEKRRYEVNIAYDKHITDHPIYCQIIYNYSTKCMLYLEKEALLYKKQSNIVVTR